MEPTPEPWEATFGPPDDWRVCRVVDGSCVCCVALMGDVDEADQWTEATLAEWEANARFIASAPALKRENTQLRQQRDTLVGACKQSIVILYGGKPTRRMSMGDFETLRCEAIAAVEAALAAVEGEA